MGFEDVEEKLIRAFPRGRGDEIRVLRCRGEYRGKPWQNTKIELRKGGVYKSSVSIRDTEIRDIAKLLTEIGAKVGKDPEPREEARPAQAPKRSYGPNADEDPDDWERAF